MTDASMIQTVQTIAGAAALLLGVALFVLSAVGLVRFPDPYTRLTAVTKSGALGICLILLAVLILQPGVHSAIALGLGILMQLLTAPIGGFALSRGTYQSGVPLPHGRYDELSDDPRGDDSAKR